MKIRHLQILIGLGSAFVFLALALNRVPLAAVRATLVNANPLWLAAAILIYAVDLSLRSWRWQIILRAVAPLPYLTVLRALVVGYGMNVIMPARLGELFRAEFCKKDFGLPRSWALTSIVIERLFDGLTVVACLGVGLLLAAARRQSGILIGVVVTGGLLFGSCLLLLLLLSGATLSRVLARFPRVADQVTMVERGLRVLRTWRTLAIVMATLLVYLPESLSLWLLVKAVGVGFGPADTLVLVGAASLSTLIPSGPAFLGTLQFAYALAFGFAGVPQELGIAAATLGQIFVLLPLAVVAAGVLAQRSGRLLLAMPRKDRPESAPADL